MTGGIIDQKARSRAVSDLDTSLCMEAGAGTGKTTLLVDRYISIISEGKAECGQIVAITFTEKAALEMKIRLRIGIGRLLESGRVGAQESERLAGALEELERAPISTIHSFASWILREHPVEAGVDPLFSQLDDLERGMLLEECWDRFINRIDEIKAQPVTRFLSLGGSVDRLRESAFEFYGKRCEVPGGNGASGGQPLDGRAEVESNATEETVSDAAGFCPHMESFREKIEDAAGSLHSTATSHCTDTGDLGYREIMRFYGEVQNLRMLDGVELDTNLLTIDLPRSSKGNKQNWDPEEKCAEYKRVARDLAAARDEIRKRYTDVMREGLTRWFVEFSGFVEKEKAERRVLDFDDLLLRAGALMDDPTTLEKLRKRYRYVLVDEFQDTDPVQARMIMRLAGGRGEASGYGSGRLFIVGDPKQSIYRFRKADVEIFEKTKDTFSERDSVLRISQNFRSVPGIVDWVNSAFSGIIRRPDEGRYQPDYEPIRPFREGERRAVALLDLEMDGKQPNTDSVREREGESIARLVNWLMQSGRSVRCSEHPGYRPLRYGDIAVLYPRTTGIDFYENPLRREGVPYSVEGGKLYYMRQEVRDIAAALWSIEEPWDGLALFAVLSSPVFGFSDEEIFLFSRSGGRLDYLGGKASDGDEFEDFKDAFDILRDLHRGKDKRGCASTLLELLRRTGYLELSALRPHGEQRVANIRKAVHFAREFDEGGYSFRRFASWFRDREPLGADEGDSPVTDEDAVRLLTIHKSKGLQFPVVIMANLVQKRENRIDRLLLRDGRMAFRVGAVMETSDFESFRTEERSRDEAEAARLLYVAATRAEDLLVIGRTPRRGSYFELLSRFLPDENPGDGDSENEGKAGDGVGDSGSGDKSGADAADLVDLINVSVLPSLTGKAESFTALKLYVGGRDGYGAAERERWVAERKGLIEAGSIAPVVLTPTGLEDRKTRSQSNAGGTAAEDTEELKTIRVDQLVSASAKDAGSMPGHLPGVDDVEGGRALRFGAAFHRLMELADLRSLKMPDRSVEYAAEEFGIEDRVEELATLIRSVLRSDLLVEASGARRIMRETPFTISIDSHFAAVAKAGTVPGGMIEGRIDLLFETENGWTAVDYKTDSVPAADVDRRFEMYRPQGSLYAVSLSKMGMDLNGGMVFYFVRSGQARKMEVGGGMLGYVEELLRSAVSGLPRS